MDDLFSAAGVEPVKTNDDLAADAAAKRERKLADQRVRNRRFRAKHGDEYVNARARRWYAKNQKKAQAQSRAKRARNLDVYLAKERKAEAANRPARRAKGRAGYAKNNGRQRKLAYREANAEHWAAYAAAYEAAHRENRRRRHHERKVTDVNYRLRRALRGRLKMALKRNYKLSSAITLLGCTIDQLKQHLERQFKPGMTWQNYGMYGWHIDHIVELALFDLRELEQMKVACHYTNLQPLWRKENISKGAAVRWGRNGNTTQ